MALADGRSYLNVVAALFGGWTSAGCISFQAGSGMAVLVGYGRCAATLPAAHVGWESSWDRMASIGVDTSTPTWLATLVDSKGQAPNVATLQVSAPARAAP
jgi:hypothetical protein